MGFISNIFGKKAPEKSSISATGQQAGSSKPVVGQTGKMRQSSSDVVQVIGILILTRIQLDNGESLVQHIIAQQRSNGYSIAADTEVVIKTAGNSWGDTEYPYATIANNFSNHGNNFEERVLEFSFQASDGNDGKYYIIFNHKPSTSTPPVGSAVSSSNVVNIRQLIENRDADNLVVLLENGDGEIREQAWKGLIELGDSAVDALGKGLKHPNWEVRWRSAAILGSLKEVRAVQPLIAALKDNNREVRTYAAEALGKIGDERAVEPLTAALNDEGQYVRKMAEISLEQISRAVARQEKNIDADTSGGEQVPTGQYLSLAEIEKRVQPKEFFKIEDMFPRGMPLTFEAVKQLRENNWDATTLLFKSLSQKQLQSFMFYTVKQSVPYLARCLKTIDSGNIAQAISTLSLETLEDWSNAKSIFADAANEVAAKSQFYASQKDWDKRNDMDQWQRYVNEIVDNMEKGNAPDAQISDCLIKADRIKSALISMVYKLDGQDGYVLVWDSLIKKIISDLNPDAAAV